MGYQDVDAFRNEIPFLQQGLASGKVKAPSIKPGLPRKRRWVLQREPGECEAVTGEGSSPQSNSHQDHLGAQKVN
jgi:hypothetical protein